MAERNAQGRWGIFGGVVICRLRLAILIEVFGPTRRAMPTARAADSSATRIPPGPSKNYENREVDREMVCWDTLGIPPRGQWGCYLPGGG